MLSIDGKDKRLFRIQARFRAMWGKYFERDDKIRERYEQYLKDKQQDIKTNSKDNTNKK